MIMSKLEFINLHLTDEWMNEWMNEWIITKGRDTVQIYWLLDLFNRAETNVEYGMWGIWGIWGIWWILKRMWLLNAGIRHPEELSFAKPLESEDLRHNYRERGTASSAKKRQTAGQGNSSADTNTFIAHHANSTHSSNNSLNDKGTSGCTPVLPPTSRTPVSNSYNTPISSPISTVHPSSRIIALTEQETDLLNDSFIRNITTS